MTQVTSWGILYYAFPVLSGRISAATGWSPPTLTAAFSAGLVVSAVAGVGVGRWIDRHGPRGVMTLGSVVAVLAVVAIAVAPTLPVFVGAWLVAGVAMAGVLYPPAFAALTRWYGPRSVGALTVLTLAGGFASTIFAPITAALADRLDWRGVYLVLAGVLAVVTIPAHAVGLRRPWPQVAETSATGQRPGDILTSRPFIALAAALALAACASHAAVVNLVPLLTERGIGIGVAAVILGLGGAGQVLGRLGYGPLHRRLDVRSRTVAVLLGVAVSTVLIAVLTGLAGLVAAVIFAGVVRGLLTLVQATAVRERWGAAHYGRLTGVLLAPATMTAALAPWIGAALAASLGGYAAMFWVMGAVALTAALSQRLVRPVRCRDPILSRVPVQPVGRVRSSSRVRTFWSRKSRSGRRPSTSQRSGSGRVQVCSCAPAAGTTPRSGFTATMTSACAIRPAVSRVGTWSDRSMPSSASEASITSSTCASGLVPADSTLTRPTARVAASPAASCDRPALCSHTNSTVGT